jgi:hypothetical protein
MAVIGFSEHMDRQRYSQRAKKAVRNATENIGFRLIR